MRRYDAVVIGSGAGGGVVSCVLAEAGVNVLLLERGADLPYAEVGRDHVRNHRIPLHGHNSGPSLEGNPRVFVGTDGAERTVRPNESAYNNNAVCVGGGTRVYGGQAWRFLPKDFRMATEYGVPKGSSLADWPLSYEELAPYYDRAEWEIGVSGDGDANGFQGPRERGYPMPATTDNPQRKVLSDAAKRLGWNTFPVPLLINTNPYHNRPSCAQCNMCPGFACPSDSKNGTQNTVIPRALASGNCTLITGAMVASILSNANGQANGVRYYTEANGKFDVHEVFADLIILSAGAIESARLLLNSGNHQNPNGLGNTGDQVGRNLQGHYYPGAQAIMPNPIQDNMGPGASIASCQFSHGNEGIVGGGMLANDFIEMPIYFWRNGRSPATPRWGKANKDWMRHAYSRWIELRGPVQEIPSSDSRISISSTVRDKWGISVGRLSGTTHPETLRTSEFMRDRAIQWLQEAGAEQIWTPQIKLSLSAGQHQAGTCRMGDDPNASVTDRWGKVHGQQRLYVADASLHVTNGGFNPVLTIYALAYRVAEHLLGTRN